jgi:hypothetical protein
MKKKTKPTMGPTPKYTGKRLEVRLTPAEREQYEGHAKEAGVTLSEYTRMALMFYSVTRAWAR